MFELPHSNTPFARKTPLKTTTKPATKIVAYAEIEGMGMGRLSDGTPYLTQRGLAVLCGVQNAHIGTISRDWLSAKPRIVAIKERLNGIYTAAHQVLTWAGRRHYCYDVSVCEAILDYYALAAGDHIQTEAQVNRLRFKRQSLADYIVGSLSPVAPAKPQPLRFMPVRGAQPAACDVMDAAIIYISGLYALSAWMANTYLEGLKQRALNAPWNRLGLYLPLKAILEIQAEAVLRMNGTFTVR